MWLWWCIYTSKGTISILPQEGNNPNNSDNEVVFKNYAPFTTCISEILNNTQTNNAKDIDVITPMYNLIEYSNNYSKTSGNFWQCYRDEPLLRLNLNKK